MGWKRGPKQRRVGIIGQNKDVQQGFGPPNITLRLWSWPSLLRVNVCRSSASVTRRGPMPQRLPINICRHTGSPDSSVSWLSYPFPVGVIFRSAYSGGAIPLAATNLLLAVKDALFSTIQPQGLASIARKQNLSWQRCQRASVSAVECASPGMAGCCGGLLPVNGKEQMKKPVRSPMVCSSGN